MPTKYVITSGVGMIREITDSEDKFDYTITNRNNEAISYDAIGDAIRMCIKINEYTNKNTDSNKYYPYRVCSIADC